jgi:hypothetical protein
MLQVLPEGPRDLVHVEPTHRSVAMMKCLDQGHVGKRKLLLENAALKQGVYVNKSFMEESSEYGLWTLAEFGC